MSAKKPERLKVVQGTARPDRQAPQPPRSNAGAEVPEPPEWLDDHGTAKWRELIPDLANRQLLTGTALSLLELLCEAWSDYRAARSVIRESGSSYASKKGEEAKGDTMMRKRPEVEIAQKAGAQYASLLQRFEQLIATVEPTKVQDPMHAFLEKRRGRRSTAS